MAARYFALYIQYTQILWPTRTRVLLKEFVTSENIPMDPVESSEDGDHWG